MGQTGLPGFDECNYALKSAAGVNSLPSQQALVACSLRLCLPQLFAYRQGLQTRTHTARSPQTSHCYRATAMQPQPPLQPSPVPLPHHGAGTLRATPMVLDERVERKLEHTYVQRRHTSSYIHAHTLPNIHPRCSGL